MCGICGDADYNPYNDWHFNTTNWERAGGFSGTMDGRFDTGKLLSIINQFSDDA